MTTLAYLALLGIMAWLAVRWLQGAVERDLERVEAESRRRQEAQSAETLIQRYHRENNQASPQEFETMLKTGATPIQQRATADPDLAITGATNQFTNCYLFGYQQAGSLREQQMAAMRQCGMGHSPWYYWPQKGWFQW